MNLRKSISFVHGQSEASTCRKVLNTSGGKADRDTENDLTCVKQGSLVLLLQPYGTFVLKSLDNIWNRSQRLPDSRFLLSKNTI